MTNFEANQILDRIRDGQQYPLHTINKALELTGDRLEPYEGLREPRMAEAVQGQSERFGTLRGSKLVA
jgi:hypothetical protein